METKTATLRNLTPHTVNLMDPSGNELLSLPSEGQPFPRVDMAVSAVDVVSYEANNFVVYETTAGKVTNLPDEVPGTVLIVSRATAEGARSRRDLVFPEQTVRDNDGRIIGCRAFGRTAL